MKRKRWIFPVVVFVVAFIITLITFVTCILSIDHVLSLETPLGYTVGENKTISFCVIVVLVLPMCAGAIISSSLLVKALLRLADRLFPDNSGKMCEGVCVAGSVEEAKFDDISVWRDHYTVCVGFAQPEMRCVLGNSHHDDYWEVPNSFIMPDGVTCLVGARVLLKDISQVLDNTNEGDMIFFVYRCPYPAEKSQLAHESRDGELVVIDASKRVQ